jgi:hypothetical protein
MPQYYLVNYNLQDGTETYNFSWDAINHKSCVVITAAEGSEPSENGQVLGTSNSPQRFVGAAPFTVHNVAPYDGGVSFRIEIGWGSTLNTWVCIAVFDDANYSGTAWGS